MVEFLRPRKAEKRPPDDDVPFGVLVPVLLCELEDGRRAVGGDAGIDIRRDLLSPGVDRDRTRAVADTASTAPAIARLGEGVTIVRQFV